VNKEHEARYYVAVIGAGPAGLFAAREIAERGHCPIIFNRDIRPGGLAEYGIYPSKIRMKEGLRNQFRQILQMEDVSYYGNVLVGQKSDFSLDDLRGLGFQALLITVGAQSTKSLGLPGEDFEGVYHAKDIVYHYNLLPPYSETTYQIGKRVAVVGVGNVMVDIARWLIEEKQVDEVLAVARRGPGEVKFDRKELETVVSYINSDELDKELGRVQPLVEAVGQDPSIFSDMISSVASKAGPPQSGTCFRIRFLASPTSIVGDQNNQVIGLEVEENMLVRGQDGEVRASGTGQRKILDVDTIIFAIGDVVDSAIGLPVQYGEYSKNPRPLFPVDGNSYEVFDPRANAPISDVFLAGWARRPSAGLVGVARKDSINAVQAVSQYLETQTPTERQVSENVRERLVRLGHPVVDKHSLQRLEVLEREQARKLGVDNFKFASNQQMLQVLGLE
jgi:ferredoxin/flavodoxin---NADP+ reductase